MMPEYVTLAVCKELLEMQEKSFRLLVTTLMGEMKDDMKSIKSDLDDVKASLEFTGKDMKVVQDKVKDLEFHFENLDGAIGSHDANISDVMRKQEYLESQSRHNNIKIFGIPEQEKETWADTEALVKSKVKDLLQIKDELCIERAHRVARRPGPGRSAARGRSNHGQDGPKPIVAKFLNWKEKEQVLAAARKIKPPDVLFLQDFSQQTLERRKEQIPKMLAARDQGKIAYFIGDKLVVKEKPPDARKRSPLPTADPNRSSHGADDSEISFGE